MWLIVELDPATPRRELERLVALVQAHRPWVREALLAEEVPTDGSPG